MGIQNNDTSFPPWSYELWNEENLQLWANLKIRKIVSICTFSHRDCRMKKKILYGQKEEKK